MCQCVICLLFKHHTFPKPTLQIRFVLILLERISYMSRYQERTSYLNRYLNDIPIKQKTWKKLQLSCFGIGKLLQIVPHSSLHAYLYDSVEHSRCIKDSNNFCLQHIPELNYEILQECWFQYLCRNVWFNGAQRYTLLRDGSIYIFDDADYTKLDMLF